MPKTFFINSCLAHGATLPRILNNKQNNMETKHTKGEWTATQTSISDSNGVIATTYVNTVKRYIGKQEAEANAKLIAAAPDLLEALQEIMDSPFSMGLLIGQRFKAFDAIKKATE